MKWKDAEDFEKVKDKIVARLINKKRNQKLLEKTPYRDFLDLAVVYYLPLASNAGVEVAMPVRNEIMDIWNVTEEELYAHACSNGPRLYPAKLQSMDDFIRKLLGKKEGKIILFPGEKDVPEMYILTNQTGIYGASVVLDPNILEDAAKRLGGDLLILPSSVHEVLLLRYEDGEDLKRLQKMVSTINQQEVPEEDILSNLIYCYRREKGKVEVVIE